MDGNEWESYCNELLSCRHASDYQRVPARVHGDWGIEGYTSDGVLYQCYAPVEPLSISGLYDKLRDKVTTDINKLIKNAESIVGLLHPGEATRWVLLTPRIEDKEILVHAKKKELEVRDLKINGIAANFTIRINTDEDFASERRRIGEGISLPFPEIDGGSDEEVRQFAISDGLPVEVLDGKLRKIDTITKEEDVRALRAEFLRFFVEGEEADGHLRRFHPSLWDEWSRARESTRKALTMTQLTSTDAPSARLANVQRRLEDAAAGSTSNLPSGVAEQLALGTVARWLLDCPLDFSAVEQSDA